MNEICVICDSEIDEAGAGGLWDLSAEICNELYGYLNYTNEQDTVYNIIRNFIENQNYCPNCGQLNYCGQLNQKEEFI